LYERDSAFGIAPLGAGKCAMTATAIADLIRDRHRRHALVISPKLVATVTWPAEIAAWKHLNHLRIATLNGSPESRRALLAAAPERDLTVIGIDLAQWLVAELANFPADHPLFDILVIDETSRLKDPSGKRARALLKISGRFRTRWGLTGTPRPNSSRDMFMPAAIITNGALWGRAYIPWRAKHFQLRNPVTDEWAPLPGAEEQIAAEFGAIAMTVADEDMPDLPPLNIVETRINLPDAVMAQYQTMAREQFTDVNGRWIEAVSPLVATGKLAQLANGFLYDDGADDPVFVHSVKIDWLRELVESLNGEPLLIAYEFVEDLRTIRRAFGEVPALGGLTPARSRAAHHGMERGKTAAAGVPLCRGRTRFEPTIWRVAHGVAVAQLVMRVNGAVHCANLPARTDPACNDSRLRRRGHRRRDEAQSSARQDERTGSISKTSGANLKPRRETYVGPARSN
jgi:hypothetical protein